MKYSDLAKILLLDLEGIEGRILEILACSSLVGFGVGVGFLLNWEKTYCLKFMFLLLAINLSYYHIPSPTV